MDNLIQSGFRSGFIKKSDISSELRHALIGGLGGSALGAAGGYFLGDEKDKLTDIILGSGFGGVGGAGLGYLHGGAKRNKETSKNKFKKETEKEK